MTKHPYRAYANANETVAKTQQIVMLYDGAIRFLRQAQEAHQNRRIEERFKLLTKVSVIINGLQGSLDFEEGGEMAKVLYGFYASIDTRIFSLHREGNDAAYEGIISDLKRMRDSWYDIDKHDSDAAAAQAMPADAGAMPPAGEGVVLSA